MSAFYRLLGLGNIPDEVKEALAQLSTENRRLTAENDKLRRQGAEHDRGLARAVAEALGATHRAAAAGTLPADVKAALQRLAERVTPDGRLR